MAKVEWLQNNKRRRKLPSEKPVRTNVILPQSIALALRNYQQTVYKSTGLNLGFGPLLLTMSLRGDKEFSRIHTEAIKQLNQNQPSPNE